MMKQLLLSMVVVVATFVSAEAKQFRNFVPIQQPHSLPEGAQAVEQTIPPERQMIETGVRDIAERWNNGSLNEVLGKDFYDARRLQQAIRSLAPRDANLRVLAVRGQQLLQQYEQDGQRISRISVTVNTQVEYNDPVLGFQQRQGVQELILLVSEGGN